MKINIKTWLLAPSLLILTGGLYAQGTSSIDQDLPSEDDVVVLTPFEVSSDSDVGYQATSTLAGTRLRTSLNDVGSSITIFNKEFLEDFGSDNIEDVMLFAPNVEVGGLGGNFSAAQSFGAPVPEQQRFSQQGGFTRVRGLAGADLTRDYFITDTPFDAFNTDRIEVQRGANAALFGLGSPGGIVNATTIKADFLRNRGHFRTKVDQYGSTRHSMRYNYIVNDYVAIRVAGLRERSQFEQRQAFSNDDRFHAAVTVKLPFNLTLRGGIEVADRKSARPDFIPPNDGITPWINLGRPIFESGLQAGSLFRGTGDFFPGRANSQVVTFTGSASGFNNFFQDPSNPNPTYNGPTLIRRNRNLPNPNGFSGPGESALLQVMNEVQIIRRTGGFRSDGTQVEAGTSGFFSGGFVGAQITDRSVFDYRKELFTGSGSRQFSDWKIYTASLTGSWLDDRLGLEASFYKQDMNTSGQNNLQGANERTIYIDANRFLLSTTDGTGTGDLLPNPTFGRPVMGSLSGGNNFTADNEQVRFSGFAKVRADDFMEKNAFSKFLGELTITGLIDHSLDLDSQRFARDQLAINNIAKALSGGVVNGVGVNSADARIGGIFALGVNSDVNFFTADSAAGAHIQGVSFGEERRRPVGGDFIGWDSVSQRFVTFNSPTFTIQDNSGFPAAFFASKSGTEIESRVLVGQHKLWDNAITLTGTWRNDKASSVNVNAPTSFGDPGFNRSDNLFDPAFLAGPQKPFDLISDSDSTSWSIMIHTPDFMKKHMPAGMEVSVYKSKAENFRPSSGSKDVLNNDIPPVTGATKEQGFIISALDGKLNARFNFYDTGVLNNRFDKGGVSSTTGILLNLARGLDNPANIAQGFTSADVIAHLPGPGPIALAGFVPDFANAEATSDRNSFDNGTQDFTSSGFEFEFAYNPNEKWTMIASIANQETVKSNTYPVLQQYVADFVLPIWVNNSFAQNYITNDLTGETLAELAQRSIIDPVNAAITEDGNPTVEERKYRVNFNTSYQVGKLHKWLGNLTVGGGVRWQDKQNLGFAIAPNAVGNLGPDLSRPFESGAQTFYDVFARSVFQLPNDRKFTLQLNIKDVSNHNELIPFLANPDGTLLYRFGEGRFVTLSGTLDF